MHSIPAARSDVDTYADAETLARAAADWLCDFIGERDGRPSVALAGGSTPRRLYEILATDYRERLPWSRVHWFFGDERFVPHDDASSNYRMVREAMLARSTAPAENVHPIPTAGCTPEQAAAAYEEELKRFYGAETLDPRRPLFDVMLLGLGEDGHTASLFPRTEALNERKRWATAVVGAKPEPRITLTYPAIENSAATVFLVSGEGKRETLARIWRGEDAPAARLRPTGSLRWLIDRAADPRQD